MTTYSNSFKKYALKQIRNSGKSFRCLSEEMKVPKSTLWNWSKSYEENQDLKIMSYKTWAVLSSLIVVGLTWMVYSREVFQLLSKIDGWVMGVFR